MPPDQRLFITKQEKNGQDFYICKSGKKGLPYFRASVSKTGWAIHFRHKRAGKWIEPYACYLSREEFSQVRAMSFPDLAAMIAHKIGQRRPSDQVSQHDLNALLAAVQSLVISEAYETQT